MIYPQNLLMDFMKCGFEVYTIHYQENLILVCTCPIQSLLYMKVNV